MNEILTREQRFCYRCGFGEKEFEYEREVGGIGCAHNCVRLTNEALAYIIKTRGDEALRKRVEELEERINQTRDEVDAERDAALAAKNAAEEQVRMLQERVSVIRDVATGEDQVANDDTEGLEWIAQVATEALAATQPEGRPTE